ncbi:MAG: SpoIIIAH-like family protein [Bacilli bacterium]|nr:SpoIIIAH-like family protein [Bacilli bacterium]
MINKKNIWFLTLFSLILVLSVYYITMPKELLLSNLKTTFNDSDSTNIDIKEASVIETLKVEDKEATDKEKEDLKKILTDSNSSIDKKNEAFDKMKSLDINTSEEENISKKVKEEFKYDTFTKIDGDKIKVIVATDKLDTKTANKIMRFIQKDYDTKKYITVEYK